MSDRESIWKTLSKYCIENRETGHRVCKIGDEFEVWYRKAGTYKQGAMTPDSDIAKQWASKSDAE